MLMEPSDGMHASRSNFCDTRASIRSIRFVIMPRNVQMAVEIKMHEAILGACARL
jgi:hypothetical protein